MAGLREMKKHKLRQSVQREAFRLFAEQGYPATTVEQIAAAAEISTTTFYRYYSSIVDVVLSAEYEQPGDPADLLAELADTTDVTATLRSIVHRSMQAMSIDRDEMLARYTLIFSEPELWAAFQQRQQQGRGRAAALLARWIGTPPDSYPVRIAAAGFSAAVTETLRYWTDRRGEVELGDLLDEMITRFGPLLRPAAASGAATR